MHGPPKKLTVLCCNYVINCNQFQSLKNGVKGTMQRWKLFKICRHITYPLMFIRYVMQCVFPESRWQKVFRYMLGCEQRGSSEQW